jgi:hypothetical protein
MPYNKSVNTVERWKSQLDKLLTGKSVEFMTMSPDKVTYRFREAIHAARHNGIEPYASLQYTFHAAPGKVIARPKEDLVVESRGEHTQIENAYSHYDVIIATQQATTPVMIFPNFSGDVAPVRRWAEARGWSVDDDPVLTLTSDG